MASAAAASSACSGYAMPWCTGASCHASAQHCTSATHGGEERLRAEQVDAQQQQVEERHQGWHVAPAPVLDHRQTQHTGLHTSPHKHSLTGRTWPSSSNTSDVRSNGSLRLTCDSTSSSTSRTISAPATYCQHSPHGRRRATHQLVRLPGRVQRGRAGGCRAQVHDAARGGKQEQQHRHGHDNAARHVLARARPVAHRSAPQCSTPGSSISARSSACVAVSTALPATSRPCSGRCTAAGHAGRPGRRWMRQHTALAAPRVCCCARAPRLGRPHQTRAPAAGRERFSFARPN